MRPKQGFANADGIRIRWHDFGGDGPDLLLVHATGFHGLVWLPWVERLRTRFRVVSLDQRGHGDSDKPEAGYGWDGFAADVLAVVDELSLERPRGVGHSAGAAALILAEASRPATFARLVLMDPVCAPAEVRELAQAGPNPMAAAARKRRHRWNSVDEMVERLRKGSPLHHWQSDFLRAYVEHGIADAGGGTLELKCPPEAEAQTYEMGMRHDGWERIGELTCPVLLLAGERSELWPAPHRERIAPTIRDGGVDVIDGGHFFPMENPDATLERLMTFLEER